jgi:cell division protein FtsI (penicillin-binding protein 3)
VSRIYPHQNLFSHVLGFVNVDGDGIAGLEAQYNNYLSNYDNAPLILAMDSRIQAILRQKLESGMKKYKAKSVLGIVTEIKTGNILGLVNLPDFDPNQISKTNQEILYNRATYGLYEMGSVFKIFTIALGLDKGVITHQSQFDVSQIITLGKYEIKQEYYSKKFMTPMDILTKSSNVGAALIGIDIGRERMQSFFAALGFLTKVPSNFYSLATPIVPKRWTPSSTVTMSYGYGIAVTPLHIVMAVGGIINNGILKVPKFLLNDKFEERRVISEKSSKMMNQYLRQTVLTGTGWRANTLGYAVGGKTGSARILSAGKYQEGTIMASFVGAFPMNNPSFLIFVMAENPTTREIQAIDIAGGSIAAPIVSEIIDGIAPLLGVIPFEERP